jgi:multidrug resistance efflux pump
VSEPHLPPEFLSDEPPHWAARGLAYLLIVLFAAALTAAIVVRVPETVSGPFVLEPVRGADPMRASRSGRVSEVRVAEGQAVRRDDPLFVIQSAPVGDRSAELRTLETQLGGIDARFRNARREYESQQQADAQEAERLQKRLAYLPRAIEFKKDQLKLTREVASRYKQLYDEGLTSWAQYAERELEISKAAVEQEELETELLENRSALDKLRHESQVRHVQFDELARRLKEDQATAQIRIAALRRELAHSNTNELTELAPCPGTVLRLQIKGNGAYVTEGEVLADLACGGERLQANLAVPQAGLGRLRPGQQVKLLYDSFPYQRYGVRYGTVTWVTPASLTGEAGEVFHAVIDITDGDIFVDGQPRPLKPGMRGTAQVVVGTVRLITYAFEPLRQLRESIAAPPAKP